LGHITIISAGNRLGRIAAALACATLLSGCGGGVELEGKIFDYAGLSGSTAKKPDPTMSSRASLMVPPNLQRLPTPTEARSVAANRQDWPDDPEKVRVREIKEQEAVDAEVAKANDPLNAYAGKETLLDKLFKGNKTVEEPVPDVPEPDSSDAVPGSAVATRSQAITPHQAEAPLPSRNEEAFNPAVPDSYKSGSDSRRNTF